MVSNVSIKVPDEFNTYLIDEICDLGRGRVISKKEIEQNAGSYPVYSSQSKDDGCFGYLSTYDFEGDYVTWTTDGAYAGTVFYRSGKFNCTNVCGTLKAKHENTVDMRFLSYQLGTQTAKFVVRNGNSKLMNNVMGIIPVLLPPLPDQRKIAAILTSVDDAISSTQRIIDQTEVVKRGLMQQLLTKGIGHTTFKQTEIGEIPAEWDVVQLDDIAPDDKPVVQTGPFGAQLKSEDFSSSGVPVLNIGNVLYGKMTFDKLDFLPEVKAEPLQRYAVSEGDLLFSRMATVGRTCVVPSQCNGWLISYHLMRLSVDKRKCNPFFLMYSFIGNAFIVKQIEAISGGGTRAGVNTSILKTLRFAMPPLREQNRIVSVLESLDKRITIEESYHQRLNTLKQGLMQTLLTGQVRVNVDEPSEVSV